jgi:hypothetical protein
MGKDALLDRSGPSESNGAAPGVKAGSRGRADPGRDPSADPRYKGPVDGAEVELLRAEVDALRRDLAEERFRHVTGIEAAPSLEPLFRARSRAAHRDTVAELRESGEVDLAARVASLRAERAAAAEEEGWRAASASASVPLPEGRVGLAEADLRVLREPDRSRRRALGRAVADAVRSAETLREAAAERRARARAEVGLSPPWEDVVQGDEILNTSEDAYREALSWLASREGLAPLPSGDLERADLRYLLALHGYEGLFRPGLLFREIARAFAGLGLDSARVRLDAERRPGKWPGAHAFEERVSFGQQGGAADWLGLFGAAAAAVAASASAPSARAPDFPAAMGALAASLLFTPRFLLDALRIEKKYVADLVRSLALRRLFELRTRAAALRVAAESERGMSGEAWHEAHREALSSASLAVWPYGLAARDSDAGALAAELRGAASGEWLRRELTERYDEDFFRNPRTRSAVAGLLAAGSARPGTERPPLAVAAEALVRAIERGA